MTFQGLSSNKRAKSIGWTWSFPKQMRRQNSRRLSSGKRSEGAPMGNALLRSYCGTDLKGLSSTRPALGVGGRGQASNRCTLTRTQPSRRRHSSDPWSLFPSPGPQPHPKFLSTVPASREKLLHAQDPCTFSNSLPLGGRGGALFDSLYAPAQWEKARKKV